MAKKAETKGKYLKIPRFLRCYTVETDKKSRLMLFLGMLYESSLAHQSIRRIQYREEVNYHHQPTCSSGAWELTNKSVRATALKNE